MFLPKVKFSIIPIQIEIDWFYYFLFYDKWGWGKKVIKKHPKLKNVFSIRTKINQKKHIKNYIIKFRIENKKIIKNQTKKYFKDWKKVEKQYLTILSEILEISWPKNRKNIKAMMSINPICPRFIDDWSFSIFYKQRLQNMKETIAHEICHFLYFKKWKKVFPNAKRKTFDYPYLEWHLSEILAPVILNDSKVQRLLKKKAVFYDEHKKIYIGKRNLPKHFELLYRKHIKQRSNFDDFLQEAYLEIKTHKNKFKSL